VYLVWAVLGGIFMWRLAARPGAEGAAPDA
jgi:hypothetical protein